MNVYRSVRIPVWPVFPWKSVRRTYGRRRSGEAINEGVRRGYNKGYLRKSAVKDPVRRGNTGDNTPAMIYTEIVPGENIKITVGSKGFGSET